MHKRYVLLAAALIAGGCSTQGDAFDSADLMGKTFTLQSVDGVTPAAQGKPATIHFAGDGKVTGAMCNRFMGQGEFTGATLTVKQLASTRMLCTDQTLNQWDGLIGETLQKGVQLSMDNGILTLKGAEHTLVYKAP